MPLPGMASTALTHRFMRAWLRAPASPRMGHRSCARSVARITLDRVVCCRRAISSRSTVFRFTSRSSAGLWRAKLRRRFTIARPAPRPGRWCRRRGGPGSRGLDLQVRRSQAQDGPQDIVHVVGHASGQAAQALHLLACRSWHLEPEPFQLGPLAFRDVLDGAPQPLDAAGGGADHLPPRQDPPGQGRGVGHFQDHLVTVRRCPGPGARGC